MKRSLLCILSLVVAVSTDAPRTWAADAPASLTVQVDQPSHPVSPMLWGIFFEDINCSADGGLYAELVRNRSFEDSESPDHWIAVKSGGATVELAVDNQQPISPKNSHSLRVTIASPGDGRAGVANDGFWGMGLNKGERYGLSLYARGGDGFEGPLTVTLEGKEGHVYAKDTIWKLTPNWAQYHATLTATDADPKARLVIGSTKPGTFWVDLVSLFPRATWKNRANGLRPDLAEMLADLKPSFNRFPGGCWVEGDTMSLAYRWKQTIGDVGERRTQHNIWNYEATHGLGFHEYLQLCEDLGAEPLFVINCGMSHHGVIPMEKMGEFVQDALDAIDYCNGPVTSQWGALRARNGHAAPFNLHYMEIGNENGGPPYEERFALFHDAIKAKYPQMKLVANAPIAKRPMDILDEHYYSSPEFFINNAHRYDSYQRDGTKIYVGEYAVTQGCGNGNLRAAIGEAAFMTGMERNSDVVIMASYAPLFANVNHRGWNPDLIDFDSSRAYGIPSYHVQKMFSENRGDTVLPVGLKAPMVAPSVKGGAIGVGTWLTQAEFKDIKVTKGGQTLFESDFTKGTEDWKFFGGDWKVKDGVLQQTAGGDNIRAFIGDKSWTDYTLSLKARKLGGAEGFLISVRMQNEEDKSWWNIGGWGNSHHALEMGGIAGNDAPGRIETGKWYDIRIELKGAAIKCYLDGKLIHDVQYQPQKALYASATQAKGKSEVILKVVNVSEQDQDTEINLGGAKKVSPKATAIVLASANPADENTLETPSKVVPIQRIIETAAPSFRHTFPANSVTVLRLKVR